MGIVTDVIGVSMFKLIIFALLLWFAYKWSNGKLDKQIKMVKRFKHRYGFVTILLVIIWMMLTPTGLPDDFLALYLIETFGVPIYFMVTLALTLYLVWRLRITLVIYRK